jgi:hypothetical protein
MFITSKKSSNHPSSTLSSPFKSPHSLEKSTSLSSMQLLETYLEVLRSKRRQMLTQTKRVLCLLGDVKKSMQEKLGLRGFDLQRREWVEEVLANLQGIKLKLQTVEMDGGLEERMMIGRLIDWVGKWVDGIILDVQLFANTALDPDNFN